MLYTLQGIEGYFVQYMVKYLLIIDYLPTVSIHNNNILVYEDKYDNHNNTSYYNITDL